MKATKTILLAAIISAVIALALILPSVVAAASDRQDQPTPGTPAISVSCESNSSDTLNPAVLVKKLGTGDLVGHVSGCVEEGALAGLSWVNVEHPGGGPGFWSLSFGSDPMERGQVAEFWVWVRVLSEPLDPPEGFSLPPEFPLMVRLIDGGESPTSADWEQLYLAGSVPLLDPETGYEECLIPPGSVQLDEESQL